MDGPHDPLGDFGDERIGALLAMAQRVAFNCYTVLLDPLHLTPGQAEILNILSQHKTVTLGGLAEIYRVKPPVMTSMVDGLVQLALIERRADPGDRRRIILVSTERGMQMTHELKLIRDRMQGALTSHLNEQEVTQLATYLKKVIRSLESVNPADVHM